MPTAEAHALLGRGQAPSAEATCTPHVLLYTPCHALRHSRRCQPASAPVAAKGCMRLCRAGTCHCVVLLRIAATASSRNAPQGDNGAIPTDLDDCDGHTDTTYAFYHYRECGGVGACCSWVHSLQAQLPCACMHAPRALLMCVALVASCGSRGAYVEPLPWRSKRVGGAALPPEGWSCA